MFASAAQFWQEAQSSAGQVTLRSLLQCYQCFSQATARSADSIGQLAELSPCRAGPFEFEFEDERLSSEEVRERGLLRDAPLSPLSSR